MAATILELRKLVSKIRSFVNAADQTDDGQMASVASAYAKSCHEINDRLTRCGDLLEKGHRSEALALSEQPSDLLEVVSICNFPEIDEWQDLSAQYGWTRPPLLLTAIADVISEAYAMREQLNSLLSKNRLLALKRASVTERLAVLRELANCDRFTAYWQEDVVNFEGARARELVVLGNNARVRGRTAIAGFLAAFRAEDWQSEVPLELQDLYATISTDYESVNVLPALARNIGDAYSTNNVAQLQSAINEWSVAIARNKKLLPSWNPPMSLVSVVNPAIARLEKLHNERKKQSFMSDVRALHASLQNEDDVQKVEYLLAAAQSHGYELPKYIEADLAAFRRGEDRASVIRTLLIIVLIIFGVSLLVFGFLTYRALTTD